PEHVDNLHRAAGNVGNVKVLHAGYLNMADLLKYERLLFTVEALDHVSRLWGNAAYTADVTEVTATPTKRTTRVAAATTTPEVVADGEEVEAPVVATNETDETTETEAKA
ncbi:MAG: hypothetical protein M3Y58_17735, partial [Chloroflexota bacterium]|nr:hypothetical protein [Chloroflexota bacterium]